MPIRARCASEGFTCHRKRIPRLRVGLGWLPNAGVAAGMNVIAWGTPFTIAGLHASRVLEHTWVVHDPEKLVDTVKERIAEHNRTGHQ